MADNGAGVSLSESVPEAPDEGSSDTRSTRYWKLLKSLEGRIPSHICCSRGHAVAVDDKGVVLTWGNGLLGQLGHGDTRDQLIPRPVAFFREKVVDRVSCGRSMFFSFCAALTDEGALFTWGWNKFGQLGIGCTSDRCKPQPVSIPGRITAVECGGAHVLCLTASGDLWAWGSNKFGQLGTGNTKDQTRPTKLRWTGNLVFGVACGGDFSAALASTGDVYTWGRGDYGQLGRGDIRNHRTPSAIRLPPSIAAIYAGDMHMGALTDGGELFMWGRNTHGQLGLGRVDNVMFPTQVLGLRGVCITKVACGGLHTIAIGNRGEVYVWGRGKHGSLGTGSALDCIMPHKLPQFGEGLNAVDTVAGNVESFVLTLDGTWWAWGVGGVVQMEHEGSTSLLDPRKLSAIEHYNIHSLSCGSCHVDQRQQLRAFLGLLKEDSGEIMQGGTMEYLREHTGEDAQLLTQFLGEEEAKKHQEQLRTTKAKEISKEGPVASLAAELVSSSPEAPSPPLAPPTTPHRARPLGDLQKSTLNIKSKLAEASLGEQRRSDLFIDHELANSGTTSSAREFVVQDQPNLTGGSKHAQLELALRRIELIFGKEAVQKLVTCGKVTTDVLSTGSLALDMSLGPQGIPYGQMVEVFGPSGSCKTIFALLMIAKAQEKGGSCIYVDLEGTMNASFAQLFGVSPNSLYVMHPKTYRDAMLMLMEIVSKNTMVPLIVFDSINTLVSRMEVEEFETPKDAFRVNMSLFMKDVINKLGPAMDTGDTTILFLSNMETFPGMSALKYNSSVSLKLNTLHTIKRGARTCGHRLSVEVLRNKFGIADRTVEFDVEYGKGVSRSGEVLDLGTAFGIIDKQLIGYLYDREVLGTSRDTAKESLEKRPELIKELQTKIIDHVFHNGFPKKMHMTLPSESQHPLLPATLGGSRGSSLSFSAGVPPDTVPAANYHKELTAKLQLEKKVETMGSEIQEGQAKIETLHTEYRKALKAKDEEIVALLLEIDRLRGDNTERESRTDEHRPTPRRAGSMSNVRVGGVLPGKSFLGLQPQPPSRGSWHSGRRGVAV